MKKSIIFIALIFFSLIAFSQKEVAKSIEFKVLGNCGDCKTRIENAADIKGVKLAVWDSETKIMKVTYKESKVSEQKIKEAIAKIGHDAGDVKGDDTAYGKLPHCCQYRDRTH